MGYVERDAFAAAILVARMEDQTLDQAPVWDDLTGFDGRQRRGVVDLVSAGYACKPFSVAGKRKGADDPRHLWPHVARVVAECGPVWVFLENGPNHLNLGYREVREELEDLAGAVHRPPNETSTSVPRLLWRRLLASAYVRNRRESFNRPGFMSRRGWRDSRLTASERSSSESGARPPRSTLPVRTIMSKVRGIPASRARVQSSKAGPAPPGEGP